MLNYFKVSTWNGGAEGAIEETRGTDENRQIKQGEKTRTVSIWHSDLPIKTDQKAVTPYTIM